MLPARKKEYYAEQVLDNNVDDNRSAWGIALRFSPTADRPTAARSLRRVLTLPVERERDLNQSTMEHTFKFSDETARSSL